MAAELEAEMAKVIATDLNAYSHKDGGAKHFDAISVAQAFAGILIYEFAKAFAAQLMKRLEEEAKSAGEKLANEAVDTLKAAAGRMLKDIRKAAKEELAASRSDLQKMRRYLGSPEARRLVLTAGRGAVAKKLEASGFPPKLAAKRAEELVKIIEARELAPA
jgi:hypothetical protein